MSRRKQFIGFVVITAAIGLIVHLRGTVLNPTVRDMLGDALWASMIMWLVSALAPRAKLLRRSAAAYAVCVVVETAQLIHTPTLDAARATLAGHLILGTGFDPRDFVAYAIGVACAALIELTVLRSGVPAHR